jgi:hypothetical protein
VAKGAQHPAGLSRVSQERWHCRQRGHQSTREQRVPDPTVKSASGATDEIIRKTDSGDVVVRRADGTEYTKAPEAGNSFIGEQVTVPRDGTPVDLSKLK